MTLNASGPISFGGSTTGQSINLELGVSATALASINSTSFRTLAGVASGQISVSNFYGKSNSPTGQTTYTDPGTYTWVVPAGVTSVSVMCVGGGGRGGPRSFDCIGCVGFAVGGVGGGGGGTGFGNNISVTPGASITLVVGSGAYNGASAVATTFGSSVTAYSGGWASAGTGGIGGAAGTNGYAGGNGGNGTLSQKASGAQQSGGGGAAGYTGNGGRGVNGSNDGGTAGSGGGGGGGGAGNGYANRGCGGGGVGLLGAGSNGAAGTGYLGGGGGSGGATGGVGGTTGGDGGAYGGGGGGSWSTSVDGGGGGQGAIRIMWPGTSRSYPSTNTGNL